MGPTYQYVRVWAFLRVYALWFASGIDLHVDLPATDHCDAAAVAIEMQWPDTRHLNCWPHACRNSRKVGVEKQFRALHRCCNDVQFDAMHRVMVAGMKAEGLPVKHIRCVEETYGTQRWRRYYRAASGVPGFTPTNNPLESTNRRFKHSDCIYGLRLSTEILLYKQLPEAMARLSAAKGGHLPFNNAYGMVHERMVEVAAGVKKHKKFYMHTGGALYIDATSGTRVPVDERRVWNYERGLKGNVDVTTPWEVLRATYLDLHKVELRRLPGPGHPDYVPRLPQYPPGWYDNRMEAATSPPSSSSYQQPAAATSPPSSSSYQQPAVGACSAVSQTAGRGTPANASAAAEAVTEYPCTPPRRDGSRLSRSSRLEKITSRLSRAAQPAGAGWRLVLVKCLAEHTGAAVS
eukprot:GHVU01230319.1.p1 GENE.GHVU01230319.1~~GHVU01230319.1.p1  ORF type:complete len:405 (-),score=27.96 GHVU01230319.1:332-1546(-)